MALLKQEYRCGIYYFNRAEPQDARLIEEVSFTVEGPDKGSLDRAADKKLDEISNGLKDGQYIDNIKWGDPQEVTPEEKEDNPAKVLYFEGAGWSEADISKATIGNCRIRTAFHLNDGRAVYLEISGSERTKHSSPKVHKWQYTGFVTDCYYITDDIPNDDCNNHSIHMTDRKRIFEYTEKAILRLVNSLGASFKAVKVVPDLGGYRVFPEGRSCRGPDGYNYGDEFKFDPEMTARREAVYAKVYQDEKEELEADWNTRSGKFVHMPGRAASPNFSLWVDEGDPSLLHLLRHFNRHNKHWTIRTDTGETLDEWMATMTEAHLGKYGC